MKQVTEIPRTGRFNPRGIKRVKASFTFGQLPRPRQSPVTPRIVRGEGLARRLAKEDCHLSIASQFVDRDTSARHDQPPDSDQNERGHEYRRRLAFTDYSSTGEGSALTQRSVSLAKIVFKSRREIIFNEQSQCEILRL